MSTPQRQTFLLERKQEVKKLWEEIRKLQTQYPEACKRAFPVGTEVAYRHGKDLRFGTVVDVGHGHRLKIQGASTAYWIDTYRIIDELEV